MCLESFKQLEPYDAETCLSFKKLIKIVVIKRPFKSNVRAFFSSNEDTLYFKDL